MTNMINPRFIYVLLCDNDFAGPLEEAVRRVFAALGGDASAHDFKRCVVSMATALCDLRDASNRREYDPKIKAYLDNQIEVRYLDRVLDLDHDGGSVGIDCNTKYIWRF
jgi:hypothetical protein